LIINELEILIRFMEVVYIRKYIVMGKFKHHHGQKRADHPK